MDTFKCPKCEKVYDINDLELWGVYDRDGAHTEFNCTECDAEILITSTVIEWKFETELNE